LLHVAKLRYNHHLVLFCCTAPSHRLRASLAEALAQQQDGPDRPAIDMDSPAEKALQLLTAIMCGEEVSARQAMEVRMAILNAGANIFAPVNFRQVI
jgi:hypothetical protein